MDHSGSLGEYCSFLCGCLLAISVTFSRFAIAAASSLVLVGSAQKHKFQKVHGIYLFLYLVILCYCVPILFAVIAISLCSALFVSITLYLS